MYALYAGKKIIGCISLSKENDNVFELHNLAVLPEYRHKGFGKRLLEHAKETVKIKGGNLINAEIFEEDIQLKNWHLENGSIQNVIKESTHEPYVHRCLEWKGEWP